MSAVVEVRGLHKGFRKGRKALNGLDLVVEEGGVHGFLGPNGSGKTTTLRILLGLVSADEGTVRLFGKDVPGALPEVIGSVGSIVESPTFFGNFSGRLHLQLLAEVAGVPRQRVDEVLETVGLADRGDDAVKRYSLGMKQRLGVATALLKQPRLIVLDEPSNGLDPAGIREMRELVRSLSAQGRTVLLSSHLLAEVEQICDTVTIVSKGRQVATGSVGELSGAGAGSGAFRVVAADLEKAAAALEAAKPPLTVTRNDDHLIVSGTTDGELITRKLVAKRIYPSLLQPVHGDLEDVFLRLTGGAGESA